MVPSPQPRSKTRSGGVIPSRLYECFSGFTHQGGDLGEVAFFPQRFIRIHNGLFGNVSGRFSPTQVHCVRARGKSTIAVPSSIDHPRFADGGGPRRRQYDRDPFRHFEDVTNRYNEFASGWRTTRSGQAEPSGFPALTRTEKESMEYLIGVGLALVVCAFAMVAGFDRDRVFYPTLLVVIATYYILFAVMGSSMPALAIESAVAAAFIVLAVSGFKKSLWLVVAALAGHGVFDFFHPLFIQNPGVPLWWPGFCMSFDILAAAILAMLLMRRSRFAMTA